MMVRDELKQIEYAGKRGVGNEKEGGGELANFRVKRILDNT